MSGPPKTPTAVLKLHGSKRAKYDRKDEPEPEPREGGPPDDLSMAACSKWDELEPMLTRIRVMTEADTQILARYCETWVDWRKVQDLVRMHGMTYIEDGVPVVFQHVRLKNQLSSDLLRMERELGLTPSSRASIKVTPKKEQGKARFFKKKKAAGA